MLTKLCYFLIDFRYVYFELVCTAGSAETVGGQATHFCTTCCYMLCSRCKERHVAQAVFATHSCIVLARADNCPEASHYNCIRHPSHPYPYSCKSCNVGGLCSVCVSVDHIDHDVTLTADLGRSPFKRSSSSLAVNPAKRCCVDGGHVVTDNDNHVHVDEDSRNESRVIGAPHSVSYILPLKLCNHNGTRQALGTHSCKSTTNY